MAEAEVLAKKPAVNPALIVVLVAALGGAAYMQFSGSDSKKASNPSKSATTSPTSTTISPAELVKQTTATTTATAEPDLKRTEPVLSERDPFRMPGSAVVSKGSTGSSSSGRNTNFYSAEPLWKGTIKTNDGQVAIVNYQGKSHLLRIGDQLPGSIYRLSEINQDSILLTSPKKPLRLQKNEEAK